MKNSPIEGVIFTR